MMSCFCSALKAMGIPSDREIIKDLEKLFFNDVSLVCFFYQVMLQAEFNYLVLLVTFIHLSFTSLGRESIPSLTMFSVASVDI
jgi:hypothetical protein